jgi:hypothetical protein
VNRRRFLAVSTTAATVGTTAGVVLARAEETRPARSLPVPETA